MHKLTLAFFALFFLGASPAIAERAPTDIWTVSQLSGDARVVHPGAQPASLKVNQQLAPGDTLLTGLTGRAMLVHGGDYIVVAPHSELKLPSTPQPSGFTRVIQNLGTLLFKVQHTGIPHFAVDTPMLAAVVKGTTFTVVVDQQRSAVQVIQGVVQVSAMDGGMSRMVEGGRTVFVDHQMPKLLKDADKPLPAKTSPSTSVRVSAAGESPLATIATLTGGLVRADLTSPPPAAASAAANPALPVVQSSSTTVQPTSAPATTSVAATAPATTNAAAPSASAVVVGTTTVASATPPTTTLAATPAAPTPAVPAAPTTVAATPVPTPAAPTPAAPAVPTTVAATVVAAAPAATGPAVTTPAVTAPPFSTAAVTVPTVTVASNSGPGSLNSGQGNLNSGPGNLSSGSNSGSGGLNSGPGSLNSGSGRGSVTAPRTTTPTVTIPSTTTPAAPTAPTTAPTLTVPSITTPIVPITTPAATVSIPRLSKF